MNCKFLSDVLSSLANPTDHRQCESEDKSENKLFVTWPRNRTVIWLCARWPLNLSTHPAKFGGHRPCGWGNMMFWNCHVTTELKCRDFFGTHSCWVSTMLSLGSTDLVKVEIYCFLFVTWSLDRCVAWLCGWGPLALSHYPAKFGVHRPCESEDTTFFICHVTMILKCHITLWVGSPHPKSPPC